MVALPGTDHPSPLFEDAMTATLNRRLRSSYAPACVVLLALLASAGCGKALLRDDLLPDGPIEATEPALRAAAAQAPGDGEAALRLGIALEQAGRHEEAEPSLRQATSLLPSSVDALHWLAVNALARGRAAEAAEHVAAAEALDPRYAEHPGDLRAAALRGAIDEALAGGAYKEASGYAGRLAAAGAPDEADRARIAAAFLGAGDAAYDAGYYRDALAAYDKAAPFADPVDLAFRRGRVHTLLGQADEAARELDTYLKGKGVDQASSARVLRELANFYESNFKFDPAEQAYRRSAELDPTQEGLFGDLAVLYLKLRRLDDAKAAFGRHYATLPAAAQVEAREAAARLYIKFQAPQLAIEALQDAIELEPTNLEPRNVLARLYLRVGDRDKLVPLYLSFVELAGTRAAAEDAAKALASLGQQQEAIDLYRRALALPGADPALLLQVGRLEHELGHDDARDKELLAYVGRAPDRAIAHEEVGLLYADLKLHDKAVVALHGALEARPGLQRASVALADIYRSRDDHSNETKTMDRFMASASDPIGARLAVGRRYMDRGDADRGVPLLEAVAAAPPGRDAEAAEALQLLGSAFLSGKRRDPDKAAVYFRALLERSPDRLAAARLIAQRIRPQATMVELQVLVQEEIARLDPADAEASFLLGQAYVAAKRLDQAITAFQRYVERAPERGAAVEKVALYLIGKGHEAEAARVVGALGADDVKDPEVHRRLARMYAKRGDIARSRHHFERFLDAGGAKPREMRALGDQLFNAQLWDLAVRAYDLAMASASERQAVSFNQGVALLKLRQTERAERAFAQVVEAEPDKPGAHVRVAQQYYEANELTRALRHFEAAFVAENRRNLDNLFPRYTDALVKAGRRDEVPELARNYVLLQGNRTSARSRAAEQLRSLGLRVEAIRVYREILVDRPGDQEAMAHIAEELLLAGDERAGVEELDRLVSLRGFTVSAVLDAIKLLERRGLHGRARALIDQALSKGRKDPWLHFARAELSAREGNMKAAHDDVVLALGLSKDPKEVLDRARALYDRTERIDLAIDLTRRAIAQAPQEPAYQLQLVDLLLEVGQSAEADQAAFRYLRLDELGAAKLADVYQRHDELDKAITHYRKALEQPLVGASGDALQQLARTLLFSGEGGDLDAAVAQYLVTARDMEQAYWDAALAYAEASRFDQMVRYLIEADRVRPRSEIRRIIALRLLADGKTDEGRRWLELYLHAPPQREAGAAGMPPGQDGQDDPASRAIAASQAYRAAGLAADAVAVLAGALESVGDDPTLLVALVALLLDEGDAPRALAELRAFLARGGLLDDATARVLGAHVLAAGRVPEAIEVLAEALEQRMMPAASVLLLELTLRAGDVSSSRAQIERLRERVIPGDPGIALRLAAACFDGGYSDLAEPLARSVALSGDPRTWGPGLGLAVKLLLLRGDRSGVDALYDAVLASQDNRLDALRGLASVMFEVQQWPQAARALEGWARIDPASPEPWRQMVAVHLLGGDDEALWRGVEGLLERSPDPDEELGRLADQMARRLRWDLAAEARRRLLVKDRGSADLAFKVADAALRSGRVDLSRESFERFIELSGRKPTAYRHVARELLAAGRAQDAALVLDRGLEVEPDAWRLHQLRGLGRLRAGDEPGARAAFVEAARLAPLPELALMEAAYQYLEGIDMSAALALDLADLSLARRADLPGALLVRGAALLGLGRGDDAERAMARFDALGYNLPDGHLEYAKRALLAGHIELARAHFDRVAQLSDDRSAVLQGIASVIREVNDRTDVALLPEQRAALRALSLGYVSELLRSDPSAAWFVTLKSDVLESSGDVPGAVAVYREALARWPADSALHNNLAYLFARRGENLEEALALVRRARALDPSQNVYYLDTEGWVLYQLGRYEEAADLIRASIRQMEEKLGSSLSESYWHLGQVLEKLGDGEGAILNYAVAMRVDPSGRYGTQARADHDRLAAR